MSDTKVNLVMIEAGNSKVYDITVIYVQKVASFVICNKVIT